MRKVGLILAGIILLIVSQTGLVFAVPTGVIEINPSPPLQVIDPDNVSIDQIVRFVISALVVVGVVAALIFLIYGGIKWVVSGGDKTAVETARGHIVAAIIGLLIIVFSFVIINLIFQIIGLGSAFDLKVPTLGVTPVPTE
ncbi:hypothetical protein C4577_07870 [Candidatus Parcubacteria bacterium]|nr:MAG: hypothetical protein C4577_07870 [Candidatus Parcubacteria bacterium]